MLRLLPLILHFTYHLVRFLARTSKACALCLKRGSSNSDGPVNRVELDPGVFAINSDDIIGLRSTKQKVSELSTPQPIFLAMSQNTMTQLQSNDREAHYIMTNPLTSKMDILITYKKIKHFFQNLDTHILPSPAIPVMAKCLLTLRAVNELKKKAHKSREIYVVFDDTMHREIILSMFGLCPVESRQNKSNDSVHTQAFRNWLSIFSKLMLHKISLHIFNQLHSKSLKENSFLKSILFLIEGPVSSPNFVGLQCIIKEASKEKFAISCVTFSVSTFIWLSREKVPCIYADPIALHPAGFVPKDEKLITLLGLERKGVGMEAILFSAYLKSVKQISYSCDPKAFKGFELFLDRLMRKNSYDAVLISPPVNPFGEIGISAAKKVKVNTFSVPFLHLESHERSLPRDWKTDFIFCYGLQCRNVFLELKYPERKLIVSGNPRLDLEENKEYLSQFHLDVPNPFVLVALSNSTLEDLDWVMALSSYYGAWFDGVVVVKRHPALGQPNLLIKDGKVVKAVKICDSLVFVQHAKAIITDHSMVGTEAVVYGKPLGVIYANNLDFKGNDYIKFGVAEKLENQERIYNFVANAHRQEYAIDYKIIKKFHREYNFKNSGLAASNFIVKAMVNESWRK